MAIPKLDDNLNTAQKLPNQDKGVGPRSLKSLDIESEKDTEENVVNLESETSTPENIKTYGELNKTNQTTADSSLQEGEFYVPEDNKLAPLPVDLDKEVVTPKEEVKLDIKQEIKDPEKEEESIEEEMEEPLEEKVIVVEKRVKSKRRFPRLGCGCRSCGCYGCLFIILIIVAIASLLYFKPAFVWNAIKDSLNKNYNPPVYTSSQPASVRENILESLTENNSVEVSESQLQSLIREELDSDEFRIDVEPNYLRVVQDVDGNEEHPLWLILEFGQGSDNDLKVTRFGFERVGIPSILRDPVSDTVLSAIETADIEGSNDATILIDLLLDPEDELDLKSVRFDKDKVTISK